jgi:hypothetical protein
MATIAFPREGQGFQAELRIGEDHLVLVAAQRSGANRGHLRRKAEKMVDSA